METFNKIAPYLIVAIVFVFIYYMYVKPQKTTDRKREAKLAELKPGDEVITISGVYANVAENNGADLLLSVIPSGVQMKVSPHAIAVFPVDLKRARALDENIKNMDKGGKFDTDYRKDIK